MPWLLRLRALSSSIVERRKALTEKYSCWLPIEQMQEDHSYEAGKFVECYMVFHGAAGKCFTCYAQEYCKNLNEDSKNK